MLFSVPSMTDYGKLSNRPLDEMIAGARVDVAPYKRDADGLRAVEAVEARRAVVAVAVGHRDAGPAGLAHRMLGDVVEASRRDLRHPRRRHRSGVPAPRERDRAIALRVPRQGDGEFLDAQRLLAGRRREDEQERRQFRHHPRRAGGLAGRRGAAGDAVEPLPAADQLDGEGAGRGREGAGEFLRCGIDRSRSASRAAGA